MGYVCQSFRTMHYGKRRRVKSFNSEGGALRSSMMSSDESLRLEELSQVEGRY